MSNARHFLKPVMRLCGYDIESAAKLLSTFDGLSQEKKDEWQHDQKWKIFNYHINNNEFYKTKVKNRSPKLWEKIPIMRKQDYQQNFNKLLSNGYTKSNVYLANTSGSSGVPFFFAKNKFAHSMTWALAENRYDWYKVGLNSKQARYFGRPLENTSKYFEIIKDALFGRKTMLVFDLSDDVLARHTELFSKVQFKMIYGYTNSLVLFAKYLIKNNLILKKICTSLKLCISTSELLSIQDREIILSGFGVTVVNEYGVSEAGGIVAFEDLDSDWILSSETQFLEIVDDNESLVSNGNSGKILITDLHNKAMPFIRYEVGDIGMVKRSKNNGKLTLASLTGRTNDLILLPSGKKSPGLTFYYISRSILESSGILKEFIIRQVQKDKFIFDIKADRDLTQDEVEDIKSKMDIYLEPGLRLEINRTEQIRRPASGKQKHFYSEISD